MTDLESICEKLRRYLIDDFINNKCKEVHIKMLLDDMMEQKRCGSNKNDISNENLSAEEQMMLDSVIESDKLLSKLAMEDREEENLDETS
ncbi:MAG: hypothetical protein MHMPM18_000054 [Marteilia pararefringens]